VTEPEKGHKLVDAAMRCVLIPDDPAEPTISQDCVGKYEYMPDESWKGKHQQLSTVRLTPFRPWRITRLALLVCIGLYIFHFQLIRKYAVDVP
jgi:hypothetical protein